MRVILWMAISVNGIIARDNNEEDFISHDSWLEWLKWVRKSECLIWGRKTHQIVKTWGKEYFNDIKRVKAVIISRNPDYKIGKNFTLAYSPQKALEMLEKEGFKSVVVTGGSGVNSSFAKLGLLDEVIVNIEPVVVGKGVPLFKPEDFDLKLKLVKMVKVTNSLLQLQYKVIQ